MDAQQARGHRHRERADGGPMFIRRREHGSWRLTADGLDHETALAVLHKRRPSVGAWPGCRVGSGGSIALNVPSRSQNAKFRGQLHQMPDQDKGSGALLVSGVMLETMSAILLPPLFGFVALLMLGIFVVGTLTVAVAPLVIGLVAAPLMGTMAVYFERSRGRAYDFHRPTWWKSSLSAPGFRATGCDGWPSANAPELGATGPGLHVQHVPLPG